MAIESSLVGGGDAEAGAGDEWVCAGGEEEGGGREEGVEGGGEEAAGLDTEESVGD